MPLVVGEVFRGLNFTLSGRDPHYFVVVSKPDALHVIVVFFTTSLEKARKACRRDEADLPPHCEPETYLEFPPSACPAVLTELSAINCNRVEMNLESFYTNDPAFQQYTGATLSAQDLDRIKKAIPSSGTVRKSIIELL